MQETGGTRSSIARGIARSRRCWRSPREARARADPGQRNRRRPAMRRLRQLFRHLRQSGAGRGRRPAGRLRRHGDPLRDAGDLWRREPAARARRQPRGRREADRAARVVGGLHASTSRTALTTTRRPATSAGGLTTILEKSLGAVAKGGTTNLIDVIGYAAAGHASAGWCSWTRPASTRSRRPGRSPAAPTSSPSPPGAAPASAAARRPSIKLATNTPMYRAHGRRHGPQLRRHPRWRQQSVEEMGERIFQAMIAAGFRTRTKSELLGYGEDEFAPWHVNAWL